MIEHVLSLTQPWSSALFVPGLKRIETRSFATRHRGRLWIHASKSMPKYAKEFLASARNDLQHDLPDTPPLGAILGYVDLYGCEAMILCDRCDGCGWYEGGAVIKTHCQDCDGNGVRPQSVTLSPVEASYGNYAPGRFAWLTREPMLLPEPIQAKGALGIWNWEPPWSVEEWLAEVS